MLEPKEGMEEQWETWRRHCENIQEMIQAYESEPVRKAMADWQIMEMKRGGPPARLEI